DARPTQSAPSEAVASFVPAEAVPNSPHASVTQSEADIAPTIAEPVAASETRSEMARSGDTQVENAHSDPPQEPQFAAASRESVAELANPPAGTTVAIPASQDSQPTAANETASFEVVAAPTASVAPMGETEPVGEHRAEPEQDSETVPAEPPRQELDVPASTPADTAAAAMAVAAGAEQTIHEAAAAAAESPAD